jgi:hypothetical protein
MVTPLGVQHDQVKEHGIQNDDEMSNTKYFTSALIFSRVPGSLKK